MIAPAKSLLGAWSASGAEPDQAGQSVATDPPLPAAAALVAGTLVRQHRRVGGSQDIERSLFNAVSRLWQAIEQGDVCLPLLATGSGDDVVLSQDLQRSPMVTVDPVEEVPDQVRPLVLSGGRLSTYRYWLAEFRLAGQLVDMARALLPASSVNLEAPAAESLGKAQREALDLAFKHRLLVLTGGPGTGKTHTLGAIVRSAIAAALQRVPQAEDTTGAMPSPFAVAVAAPTGKATARIANAIETALGDELNASVDSCTNDDVTDQSNILFEAMTLHRLLGLNAAGADEKISSQLPFDLIVIDESSMVDTLMAARLLSSLRDDARLILAGDRDQLSSVQAGAFFSTLCTTPDKRIAACRIELNQNYRQKEALEIVAWADAVRMGTDMATLPTGQQVLFEAGGPAQLVTLAADRFRPLVIAAARADENDCLSIMHQYLQVQVLAMFRSGPEGIDALNQGISQQIQSNGRGGGQRRGADPRWFAGRLVVVRKNAAHRGLFNGDIGLCVSLPDGNDRSLRVVFEQPDGAARFVLPSQMPRHEDAWALTVHQAQGSDFDQVLFLPAPAAHPLASREGVYTAITRARRKITIFGAATDIAAAAARPGSRESGLMDALSRVRESFKG